MNIEFFAFFIEIVQAGAAWGQDIVWLKADHIVKESAEFIYLTLHLDVGP